MVRLGAGVEVHHLIILGVVLLGHHLGTRTLALLVGVFEVPFGALVLGLLAGVERAVTPAPTPLPPILRFKAATCSVTALAVGWKSSFAGLWLAGVL